MFLKISFICMCMHRYIIADVNAITYVRTNQYHQTWCQILSSYKAISYLESFNTDLGIIVQHEDIQPTANIWSDVHFDHLGHANHSGTCIFLPNPPPKRTEQGQPAQT